MSLDPRFATSLDAVHARGILPIVGKLCSVEGCEEGPTAAEPRRHAGKIGVSWYCEAHQGDAPAGAAFPIIPVCGAPAETHNAPCGGATSHLLLADVDGVDGLRLVPLCQRHATMMIDAADANKENL